MAISVEGVSKSFVLRRSRAGSLRDRLSLGRLNNKGAAHSEEFWALRDVSFEVQPGQSVGIVGHNGSGKSTMLKILTGILKPTTGSIRTRGRIGALIEVGAGFHPDLSGRENIYLNGSILGLSRREVASRFDEIVSFASLERFIDTPVKRYSSGMYMRLGMAIAFHTDPDVLLIDEVLAVGDTQFQRKCINRLGKFVAQGGCAIFVSHSMGHLVEVCQNCVWLDHGTARYIGPSALAIEQYMAVVAEREDEELKRDHPEEWIILQAEKEAALEIERREREEEERRLQAERDAEEVVRLAAAKASRMREEWLASADRSRILGIQILDDDGRAKLNFRVGDSLEFRIGYQFIGRPVEPNIAVEFYRADGMYCFGTSNDDHQISFRHLSSQGEVVMKVDFLALNQGEYRIRLRLWCDTKLEDWQANPDDVIDDAARITVDAGRFAHGCVYLPVRWYPDAAEAGAPDAPREVRHEVLTV